MKCRYDLITVLLIVVGCGAINACVERRDVSVVAPVFSSCRLHLEEELRSTRPFDDLTVEFKEFLAPPDYLFPDLTGVVVISAESLDQHDIEVRLNTAWNKCLPKQGRGVPAERLLSVFGEEPVRSIMNSTAVATIKDGTLWLFYDDNEKDNQ